MRRRLSRQAWPNLWKLYDNSSLTLRQTRLAEPHRATGRPEFRRGALKILAITVPHLRNFAYPAKHSAGSQCGDQIQVSPQRICFRLRRPRFRFSRDTSPPPPPPLTSIIHRAAVPGRTPKRRRHVSGHRLGVHSRQQQGEHLWVRHHPHRPLVLTSSNVPTGQKHTTMEKLSRSLTGYPSRAPAWT